MKTYIRSRVKNAASTQKRSGSDLLGLYLGGNLDDLSVCGYTSLLQSPDVAAAISPAAEIIGSTTIYLMRNTDNGDVRVKNALSRFLDVTPYALGTRKTLMEWIVTTMLAYGNAYVLPVTQGGQLADLVPMTGASASETADGSYSVLWKGRTFMPDEVLNFPFNVDPQQPWRGRGVRIQLRDVLQNLKQASATTNQFMSSKWKPSVIVKVDGLSDEFSSEEGRKRLLERYIASEDAGQPWMIPSDLIDVQTVKPLSLADLAINDSVQLDRRSVAAAFGTPPFLLGIGEYKQDEYNNYIRRKIVPLSTGIAQELTRKLLTSPDLYFKFSTRRLYAYSLSQLAQVGDDQYVRGIMTGNEVREWLDLSPREGLDELVILENYIPRGMIGDQNKLKGDGSNGNE